MADHFEGRKTFYFTADGRCRGAVEVLVNIDIDCHKRGSLAGAIAFAEHLRAAYFPGLYFEASTNGNGVHCYLVVVKWDLGDQGLNSTLRQFDRWLKAELARVDWDVEAVEVKGHAPEFGWGYEKYELLTYRSGQLAKLPREALTRADELMGTTRMTVSELGRLTYMEAMRNSAARMSMSLAVPERVDVELRVRANEPVMSDVDRQEPGTIEQEPVRRHRSGSISGHHFGPEELARLGGGYLDLARGLLGERKLVATGRKVVTAEDLAVFLMVLKFFTTNMNSDGSLPTARWREMWSALHEAGDVDRPWCHHRYAAMRNFVSGQGLLAWEDEGYVIGSMGAGGVYLPGRAARWHAGKQLMAWMEEVGEGVGVGGSDQNPAEREGEEEDILYGCSEQDDWDCSWQEEEPEDEEKSIAPGCVGSDRERERGEDILYGCSPEPSTNLPPSLRLHRAHLVRIRRLGIIYPPRRPCLVGQAWGGTRSAA